MATAGDTQVAEGRSLETNRLLRERTIAGDKQVAERPGEG